MESAQEPVNTLNISSSSDPENNNLIQNEEIEEVTDEDQATSTTCSPQKSSASQGKNQPVSRQISKQHRQRVMNYKKQPIVHKYQPVSDSDDAKKDKISNGQNGSSTCQCIAQVFCFSTFVLVVGLCIFDLKLVQMYFNKFIIWVREHPFLAIGAIDILYSICLVMTMPITLNHIMLGFTYSQVFKSKIKGFLFTIPISMSGVLVGSLLSFSLSRYLFKQMVTN